MSEQIDRIREHPLSSVWSHEEYDFTTWLTDNIEQLGEALGIEIEDARSEEQVGDFSSDIVARELNTGEPVVIENQYNTTDHDHLGKLLTYSSGKDAGYSVWLAEEFRPEHRSVLEWLNQNGPKEVQFFAVKPRVVSIGESDRRGFEFEIIVEPNQWNRDLSDQELTETEAEYQSFFADLIEAYAEDRPQWNRLTPGPRGYLTFGAGRAGVSFGWVFHQGPEFSVELYISTSSKETNEAIFDALKEKSAEIETSLETELTWQKLPEKQACRIKWPRDIPARIDDLDADQQTELIDWGINHMAAFQDTFEPLVAELDMDMA